MPMSMREQQARDEANYFIEKNAKQLDALIDGVADNVVKFFGGERMKNDIVVNLGQMVRRGLEEHFGPGGKLFVLIKDGSLRVEVHEDDDFDDLTKGPHVMILALLGTTEPPKPSSKKVEQHPADKAVGAMFKEKGGGPIGHA